MNDTIYAPATGAGRAAVAVIRVSGPASSASLELLAARCPEPRVASLAAITHPLTGSVIDRGLVLWFPAPRSFTGEDSAEFQVHGSRAVLAALLDALSAVPGCRPAEPGEFTRRAFLNGKLDLAAVEGLADLIDAQTEVQRRQALRQYDGALGRWVGDLRERLLDAQALAESAIDFADEGDVSATAFEAALGQTSEIADIIRAELDRPPAGERIREGFVVTLAGPPNAGKSTLLNCLARREAAIVSPHAGTTRDPIEVDLDLDGYSLVLIDTAGLRPTVDPVELEGIARAEAKARAADLVLWLQDATENPTPPSDPALPQVWTIGTKADRPGIPSPHHAVLVSAQTGAGLEALIARLKALVIDQLVGGDAALVSRARHRIALVDAEAALRRAACVRTDAELMAEELRAAARALGRITGRIDVEEILGAIFSRFCVGK